jgi:hypothetical protein
MPPEVEVEVVEEEAPELNLEEEPEISNDEILGAIDAELEVLDPDAEAVPVAEGEPEVVPEAEAAPEVIADDVVEPEPDPETVVEPVPEPEPVAEAKPSDEFGSLEEDAPEKTRHRFEAIKEKYDELVTERDAVRSESDTWVKAIEGTGTNPEQFGMAINWLTDLNSKTPEGLERAYATMSNELGVIAKMIGKPAPGVYDPLSEYPDLKQRVDDGMLDEADAHEIIQARATQTLNTSNAEEQSQEAYEKKAYDSALAEVKVLGNQLQATDPLFAQKMPYLEPIITSIVKASPNHPELWKDAVFEAYSKLPATAAVPTAVTPATPNPIRPGGTGPSNATMDTSPGSIDEAVNLALDRGW